MNIPESTEITHERLKYRVFYPWIVKHVSNANKEVMLPHSVRPQYNSRQYQQTKIVQHPHHLQKKPYHSQKKPHHIQKKPQHL
nr:unnamed protein product [Callosobruchus analis]